MLVTLEIETSTFKTTFFRRAYIGRKRLNSNFDSFINIGLNTKFNTGVSPLLVISKLLPLELESSKRIGIGSSCFWVSIFNSLVSKLYQRIAKKVTSKIKSEKLPTSLVIGNLIMRIAEQIKNGTNH